MNIRRKKKRKKEKKKKRRKERIQKNGNKKKIEKRKKYGYKQNKGATKCVRIFKVFITTYIVVKGAF